MRHASQVHAFAGFEVGQRLSILAKIRSAVVIASAMAISLAGDGLPSHCASFRAARMLAAISRTRFRPSSICSVYHLRFLFANHNFQPNWLVYSQWAGRAELFERERHNEPVPGWHACVIACKE
jgi:hypothetical protein